MLHSNNFEIVQQLKAVTALPKDLKSVPSRHMAVHNSVNSSFKGSDTLHGYCMHVVPEHKCSKVPIHINFKLGLER